MIDARRQLARRLPIPLSSPIHRFPFVNHLSALSAYAILLVWCVFLFGYGIDTGTLYRTEALRAIIGREALNGSWLVPTLYGEPFLTKPPGMYVAIGAASLPFGEVTTVSARIPSVLAATVTVFLFFAAFRRVVDRRLALAGAMLMPVSFLWLEKAPSAEIDMLQLAWVSAALLCFLRAPRRFWLVDFGAAVCYGWIPHEMDCAGVLLFDRIHVSLVARAVTIAFGLAASARAGIVCRSMRSLGIRRRPAGRLVGAD